MYAQKDDGEAGCRRGTESLGSDGLGAEDQCAEGNSRGSGAVGDRVSVERLLRAGYVSSENKCKRAGFGYGDSGLFECRL